MDKIKEIIKKWKLNQAVLASKINMPVSTFKNKLNENQQAYKFTESETEKLTKVLKTLANEINDETNV